MTLKEKAVELVDKYQNLLFINVTGETPIYQNESKQCAIIAVDRELQTLTSVIAKAKQNEIEYINEIYFMIKEALEVKEEIEKL